MHFDVSRSAPFYAPFLSTQAQTQVHSDHIVALLLFLLLATEEGRGKEMHSLGPAARPPVQVRGTGYEPADYLSGRKRGLSDMIGEVAEPRDHLKVYRYGGF